MSPSALALEIETPRERRRYVHTIVDGPAELPRGAASRAMTLDGVDDELPAALAAMELCCQSRPRRQARDRRGRAPRARDRGRGAAHAARRGRRELDELSP